MSIWLPTWLSGPCTLDGISKRQYQSINKENIENGTESTSTRFKTIKKEEEETEEWTLPSLQSQPYPEEENIEEEKIQETSAEKNQDSSPPQTEDSIIKRHRTRYTATRIKYSPTRIKSRKFLSNISYTGINKNDFYNENFILDVYILVKNLNPFSLQRKTPDKLKHEIIVTRKEIVWKRRNFFCLCSVPNLTRAHSFHKGTKSSGKF